MHAPITPLLLAIPVLLSFSSCATHQPASTTPALGDLGTYAVEEEDFVYAVPDGLELQATIYRPKRAGTSPAVVDVHGGAWNLYDRTIGAHYDRALASAGLVVLAVDFRQGPDFQHPLGSRDVAGAVRYLRVHASRLGVDPESLGLIGSSSGGHLALLAGVKPNDPMHRGTPIRGVDGELMSADEADRVDASVAYVVAMWPVSDPAYRYAYAKEVGRDELVELHEGYFGSVEAMRDASIARVIRDGEAVTPLPALLVVQAGDDANVPRAMTFELMAAVQDAGGDLDYLFFPGMPHAFGHRPSAATDDMIRAIRDFIDRQLAMGRTAATSAAGDR